MRDHPDTLASVVPAADEPDGDDWAREVYGRLLKERIVFVGSEIEDVVADRICRPWCGSAGRAGQPQLDRRPEPET
jgi:hypothetical protein